MRASTRFAYDVGLSFFATISTLALGFVIAVFLARYLGANDLGLYKMVSTVYGLTVFLAAFGIPPAVVKFSAEWRMDQVKMNRLASSSILNSVLFGACFSIGIFLLSDILASFFSMPGLAELFKLIAIAYPFALVGGVVVAVFNGLRDMKKYCLSVILQNIVMLVVSVALVLDGMGVTGVLVGVIVSSIFFCAFSIFTARRIFSFSFTRYSETSRTVLSFGSRMLLVNGLSQVYYHVDVIVMGIFLTASSVGYYSIAVSLSKFLWLMPSALQTITFPVTSEIGSRGDSGSLKQMVNTSLKVTAVFTLPIALAGLLFAEEVVSIVFGNDFSESILPFQILLVAFAIYGVIMSVGGTLPGIGRLDLALRVSLVTAALSVGLNVVLIPTMGIPGAAIAALVSYSSFAILIIALISRELDIGFDYKWHLKSFSLFGLFAVAGMVANSVTGIPGFLLLVGLWGFYGGLMWRLLMDTATKGMVDDLIRDMMRRLRLVHA